MLSAGPEGLDVKIIKVPCSNSRMSAGMVEERIEPDSSDDR